MKILRHDPVSNDMKRARLQKKIQESQDKVREVVEGLSGPPQPSGLEQLRANLTSVLPHLENIRRHHAALIELAKQLSDEAHEYLRLLQLQTGALRPVNRPDLTQTVSLVVIFWLLEALLTGAMMIAEGKMLVMEGFAYGLIFAGINVIVGLLTGYLALQPALAYINAPDKTGGHIVSMALGWLATSVGMLVLTLLIFSAARVRALGGHEHIFDFAQVSALGTFDDAIAILIVVLGAASSIIAIREGYCGLVDPIPGLSKAAKQAGDDITNQVEEGTDAALEQIADLCDELIDEAEEALEAHGDATEAYRTERLDANKKIRTHNTLIDTSKRQMLVYAKVQQSIEQKITRRSPSDSDAVSDDLFDDLKVFELTVPELHQPMTQDVRALREAINSLAAKRLEVEAAIEANRSAFFAVSPGLSVYPKTQGQS